MHHTDGRPYCPPLSQATGRSQYVVYMIYSGIDITPK